MSIRLEKFALESSQTASLCDPLLLVVSQMMSRIAESQGIRHFLLTPTDVEVDMRDDSGAKTGQVLLWLFQPRIRIALRSVGGSVRREMRIKTPSTADLAEAPLVVEACKILFRSVGPEDETRDANEATPQASWSNGSVSPTEPLLLPSRFCRRLIAALQASNTVYPASRRSFGADWSIGWLPRGEDEQS